MTIEERYRAAILADATMLGYLVTRFYDTGLPPGPTSYPAAVFQRIGAQPLYTQDQSNAEWGRFGHVRIQNTFLDSDSVRLGAVVQAFKAALKTFNLAESGTVRHAPNFVLSDGPRDRQGNATPAVFSHVVDVRCFYRED